MAAGSKEERASESAADPAESFLAFRKSGLAQFVSAWSGLGQLPFVVLIFFPRLCLSMLVVAAGAGGGRRRRMHANTSCRRRQKRRRRTLLDETKKKKKKKKKKKRDEGGERNGN